MSRRDLSNTPSLPCVSGVSCAACAEMPLALCQCEFAGLPGPRDLRTLHRGDPVPEPLHQDCMARTVATGMLAWCCSLSDGRRQILFLSCPGEVLLPLDRLPSSAWIEALTTSVVCEAGPGDLPSRGGLGRLEQGLRRAESATLDHAMVRIAALGRMTGFERLTGFLTEMTHRLGLHQQDGWTLVLPLSREDIADYLGLNSETVSRLVGQIKRTGLVRFSSPTHIHIPDLDKLANCSPL